MWWSGSTTPINDDRPRRGSCLGTGLLYKRKIVLLEYLYKRFDVDVYMYVFLHYRETNEMPRQFLDTRGILQETTASRDGRIANDWSGVSPGAYE